MNDKSLKISIITVCYNNVDTIEDTIQSVFSQTYDNYEYIIVDGQSSDGTLEIIKRYSSDSRMVVISEKDQGLYDAMNKGIDRSTGDIIGIINSDDVLYDTKVFQTIVNHYTKDTDILYADVLYCDSELEKQVRNYISGEKYSDAWCPAHPSMYVRREVFNRIGKYNLEYKVCADYDFMVRCNTNNINYTYVNQYFVKMRIGGASNGLKGYWIDLKECRKILIANNVKHPYYSLLVRCIRTIKQIIEG